MCLRGAMEFKDSIQPNFLLFPICFPLRPFVLMGAIMHNGLMLLRSFSWEENNIITPMTPPPQSTGSKYADWKAEDTQIRSCLWNSMESKIS